MDQARRIALAAQGFADAAPRGTVDRRNIRRAIRRMGLLQIDSVNVCVRSHYMPLFSRLGPYRRELVDEMAYRDGELFEYWGHEASFLPMDTYPLFRHRMSSARPGGRVQQLMDEHPGYIEQVYAEVHEQGPLSVGDLEDGGGRTGPWWGHGKGKIALEWLFRSGRIGCSHRHNFTRYYDIAERIIPDDVLNAPVIEREEAHKHLLLMAARSHGVGTASDLADYYRIRVPAARPLLAELVEDGRLELVRVEGWKQPAYLHPGIRLPRHIAAGALLTPFDPVIWERSRAERLFGFQYRIEIYVPEPQRQFGYYVYPLLMGDALVARVDLKSDRGSGRLLVKGAFLEAGQDPERVADALAIELRQMALWLAMEDVEVADHGSLAADLSRALG